MNVAEGFIYITVCFPEGWKVSNRLEEKYDVKAIKTENDMGYYFFTSMEVGFEKLFDAIEDTISFNEVALLKQQLFMEKIKELQILFEDEPLDVLETIEFKYKKRKGRKNDTKEKEVELCQQES
jgi:hypothetical protein